jgi:flagellar biosynthesis protein FliP
MSVILFINQNKKIFLALLMICFSELSFAQSFQLPGIDLNFNDEGVPDQISNVIKVFVLLTVLSLAPGILVVMTSFSRIIIVLALMRQALGMQQTPPNTVLISLALFLTIFSMMPVFKDINEKAFQPYSKGVQSAEVSVTKATRSMKEFMLKQTREEDLLLMAELSKRDSLPSSIEEVDMVMLVPAFMLSEMLSAFQIGFIIFIPFVLIDLVVSSILMSMGMMMVPPMMISLPIKILLFILIDGWNLIIRSLMQSFL